MELVPLISEEIGEGDTGLSGWKPQSRNWKQINNEVVLYSENPWRLSQKFRPKSFDELVGQSVAARSLFACHIEGEDTLFYLLHGARGAGKTSKSKIFATVLHCFYMEDKRPCGSCQECMLYFKGKSRDIKEVDTLRINRVGRMKSLVKTATLPPISSKFKVFNLDECHLLHNDTWEPLLTNLDSFSQHVVSVMVTTYLDKLPKSGCSIPKISLSRGKGL